MSLQSTLTTRAKLVAGATLINAAQGFAMTRALHREQWVAVVGRENAALVVRLPELDGLWLAYPQDVVTELAVDEDRCSDPSGTCFELVTPGGLLCAKHVTAAAL